MSCMWTCPLRGTALKGGVCLPRVAGVGMAQATNWLGELAKPDGGTRAKRLPDVNVDHLYNFSKLSMLMGFQVSGTLS